MATLHVHADESGNFTFSPKGTSYYVFSAAWTYEPLRVAQELTSLRFDLLKQGEDLPHFHATSDKNTTRNAVIDVLLRDRNWSFCAVVVEKSKVNPTIRDKRKFYPRFLSSALRFVFRGCMRSGTDRVLIYTDRLPIQKQKKGVEKAIKLTCAAELAGGTDFHVYHHPCESNPWLQVADYCSWSVFRKWESGDTFCYDRLRPRLEAPEADVLSDGRQRYY